MFELLRFTKKKKRLRSHAELSAKFGRPLLSEEFAKTQDAAKPNDIHCPILEKVFNDAPGLQAQILHYMEFAQHQEDNAIRSKYMNIPEENLPKYTFSNTVRRLVALQKQKCIHKWNAFCNFFYEEPTNRNNSKLFLVKK